MYVFFYPLEKGSKRIKNKNTKSLPDLKLGITELKINQLNKLRIAYKKIYKKKKLEIIISTDCKKIYNFSKKFDWLKVIKRKKKTFRLMTRFQNSSNMFLKSV